jgi:hypothetical protein
MYLRVILIVLFWALGFNAQALANNPVKTSAKPKKLPVHFTGNIRSYYFTREFGNPRLDTQSSFSLGGRITVLTDPFWHGVKF